MQTSFMYHVPTRIYFGHDQFQHLTEEIFRLGQKLVILYGSERFKTTELYHTIRRAIHSTILYPIEAGGIEPNPRHSTVNQIADLCKENGTALILAVGGGSVIDSAKLLSVARYYDGDCWDFVTGKKDFSSCHSMPIITIPTIAGTGSELDAFGIVSNTETQEKLPFYCPRLFPAASFLDPVQTYTVSKFHTACGAIDALSHYLEVYFMRPQLSVNLRVMEGFMKSIVESLPVLMEQPTNYEARANIMWAAAWALNGFTFGPTQGYPFMCHWIEDEVSAKYNITHGLGLAIILPHYLSYCLNEQSAPLYYEFGTNVLGLASDLPPLEVGQRTIDFLRHLFFNVCGLQSRLRDYGIASTEKFAQMARISCRGQGTIQGFVTLNEQDIINILSASL